MTASGNVGAGRPFIGAGPRAVHSGAMPMTVSTMMQCLTSPLPMAPVVARPSNMKQGDWMCGSCGNHNFASRVECNRCHQLRPGFKHGDWVCRDATCRNHNFKSRTECNKCNAPKEA